MSNIAKIKNLDIGNGAGLRVSVYFSGCTFACKDCFNSDIWDFNAGQEFDGDSLEEILTLLDNEHIAGISILGGEPLHPYNIDDVSWLIEHVKFSYPNKNIWLWTGYEIDELKMTATFEEIDEYDEWDILRYPKILGNILQNIDVITVGRFDYKKKDLTRKYSGSTNQITLKMRELLNNSWELNENMIIEGEMI